jgi:TolB-like protein/tetratricopeptide (TPR) repeat protein/DNA-binding winged helix-turn-helix (wHTH) protein
MNANELEAGFRLNDWLVEPRQRRFTGTVGSGSLTSEQLEILECLAEHHGEAVDAGTLRSRLWPDGAGDDDSLRALVQSLLDLFGDPLRSPNFIVPAGDQGYALIAHFEPLLSTPPGSSGPATAKPGLAPVLVGRFQTLISELRRRHVFKVAGAYLVAAWIVLQVAETTFEPLHLPGWWITALTILAIIGLPIVTVLAWSYEITPGGIIADPAGRGRAAMPRSRRSLAPWLVAGVVAMAGVTGLAWWRSIENSPAEPAYEPAFASVAVLPFVDMSPDGPGGAYLGDGLSEELSARLAQIRGLRVAARTSAFAYKDRSVDAREIGRTLGVRHVLEGSVRRAGDSLRVTVQLIDAQDGFHVWSESYDRSWRDLLQIQADIARSVTDALELVLTPERTESANARPDLDIRAFDPYLAGLALLRQSGDMSGLNEAQARFEEALAIEPSFARAHAGLCTVGVRRYDRMRDPADLLKAERHCRRALDLDASLVETEKALAALYGSSGQFDTSASVYRTLLTRNREDADGYIGLGKALEGLGKPAEAEQAFRSAVGAEPAFWGTHNALGGFLFEQGRIDEAAAAYQKVTELAPSNASGYTNLGAALEMGGDFERAAVAFRRSLAIEPSANAHSNLGTMHFYLGRFAEAANEYQQAAALAGENLTMWGNLGDALWQLAPRREEAPTHYRRAIVLAERELEMTPDDALIAAQAGYYYGRVGNVARSRDRLQHALRQGPQSPFVHYYAALAAADAGKRERASEHIHRAIQAGYPELLLRADPGLAGLHLATEVGAVVGGDRLRGDAEEDPRSSRGDRK